MLHPQVDFLYDGQPASVPEDARQQAMVEAQRLRDAGSVRKGTTVYRSARPDNDMPEGPWTYAKPPCRSCWRATFACLALFVLLPFAASAAEPCKVNVSTCKAAECAYLPGIGPSKGAAIEAAHPADEAALDAVPGIGEATLAKIRPFVVYQGETTCTEKIKLPRAAQEEKGTGEKESDTVRREASGGGQ